MGESSQHRAAGIHTASPAGAALPDAGRQTADEAIGIAEPGILSPPYRAATIGIVGLVSVVAFEAMGSAAIMPAAAAAMDGLHVYGFLFGGPLAVSLLGMVLAGQWSDQHGPMRAVWIGAACFVAGLLVAAQSSSIWGLLLGRLTTGLGSGMVGVALYALVGRVYPPAMHSRIFAAFAAAWMLPALIGPGLAGLIAEAFGWRYGIVTAAVLAVPVCILLARVRIGGIDERPHDASGAAGKRMLWALGATGAAIVLHMLGQSDAGAMDSQRLSIAALPFLLAAGGLLFASARRLLPQGSLTASRGLPAAIALSGLSQGAFFAAEAFLPLLLHREKGASIAVAGLVLSAGAVSWSAGAFCRARIHERVSVQRLLRSGFSLLAAGIVMSALVLLPAAPPLLAMFGWILAGAGMGLVSPTLSVVTLALASPGAHGHAGASLRLSAALSTTSVLAVSGATFALLLTINAAFAYAASLGLAAILAVFGAFLAGRVDGVRHS
ncbi:MAG: MFS transporter [Pseudomonadota bacterium]|nr:MFS transporter [Pseudomonadota bacterium]